MVRELGPYVRQHAGLMLFGLLLMLVLNHYAPKAAAWLMGLIIVGLLISNWRQLSYYAKG